MKKKTLLQEAKQYQGPLPMFRHTLTDEHIELALAWLQGEISPKQIKHVLQKRHKVMSTASMYVWMAMALREAYYNNRLTIK